MTDSYDLELAGDILMLDTQTGIIHAVPDDFAPKANIWWWSSGNGGCDCNRYLACDLPELDEPYPCGSSRFVIVDEDGDPRDLFNDNYEAQKK